MNPIGNVLVKIFLICIGVLVVAARMDRAILAQSMQRNSANGFADKRLSSAKPAINLQIDAAPQSLDSRMKFDDKPTKEQQTRDRIVAIGLIGGTLLALLGVVFGYLRLDHATRGFYCGRLQMLALACSVLILAVGYFLWSQVLFK